ncbi:YraN family protein [Paenibacillus sp. SN-8-1]|uniref:YraN family protein n=1 Tax=Paenibacillus sp. SN-8-1 TaxID=3435409 RepID=UPI003D9A489D
MESNPRIKGKHKDLRKERGSYAEDQAASYLIDKGYRIIHRNWRCRTGEIDVIAELNYVIIFVEVRSRSSRSLAYGTAMESITPRKVGQVRSTAAVYLHSRNRSDSPVRFDVIAVQLGPDGQVESLEHVENAF